MKNKFLLTAVVAAMTLGINAGVQAESFTYHSTEEIELKHEGQHYVMTKRDKIQIPEGTYTGVKLEYIISHEDSNARVYDLTTDFFHVATQPEYGPGTFKQNIGAQVPRNITIGEGVKKVTLDIPLYFHRDFKVDPQPYNGGDLLGLRHKHFGSPNTTASWKNIKLELYEAEVNYFEGDAYSEGRWHRPLMSIINDWDRGRSQNYTPYSTFSFTVEENGIYGVHTQFKTASGGTINNDGSIFIFEGEPAIEGDYSNIIAVSTSGVGGGGHPDIDSIYLKKGDIYTLVYTVGKIDNYLNYKTWIGGPGKVVEK